MTDPRYIPPSDRDTLMQCSDDDNMRIVEILGGSVTAYEAELEAHAAFMDERDARQRDLIRDLENTVEACEQVIEVGKANETRQRDLIRRLYDAVVAYHHHGSDHHVDCPMCRLLAKARGVEATNE